MSNGHILHKYLMQGKAALRGESKPSQALLRAREACKSLNFNEREILMLELKNWCPQK